MRIVVCDDDIRYCEAIRNYLISNLDENYESVIDIFNSAVGLVSFCTKYSPDILFLDIELGDMNGIELAKCLRREFPDLILIYITSHHNYVFNCFETVPLNFLRKPLNRHELDKTFKMLIERYREIHKTIPIKWHKDLINLEIRDICYIESYSRHLIFRLINGDSYEVVGKINDIYDNLKIHGFVKSHQGFVVNMLYIKNFGRNEIYMKNGATVLMSMRKKRQTREAYSEYVTRGF